MSLVALICVLGSVTLVGFLPNLNNYLLKHRGFSELELLIVRSAFMSLCAFAALFVFRAYWQHLPSLHNRELYIIALTCTTLANVGVFYFGIRALRFADVSFVSPIAGMTPGIVAIAALFFGEIPGILAWIGIFIIIIGAYLHGMEGSANKLRDYVQPLFFWELFLPISHLPEHERRKRMALRLAYASAACATVGLFFDGTLARSGNPALGIGLQCGSLAVIFLLWYLITSRKNTQVNPGLFFKRIQEKKNWLYLLIMGIVLAGISPILLATAYVLSPIAYVGSMKRLSIFISMLIAFYVFKELNKPEEKKLRYRRLAFGGLIVIGSILVMLDPTVAHLN
jgi:drug/metabolite transporter (DMT)-like permease